MILTKIICAGLRMKLKKLRGGEVNMSVDGERMEINIHQMYRDLMRGKFTLEELKFFEFGFKKLAEATGNTIKKAETDIMGKEEL